MDGNDNISGDLTKDLHELFLKPGIFCDMVNCDMGNLEKLLRKWEKKISDTHSRTQAPKGIISPEGFIEMG